MTDVLAAGNLVRAPAPGPRATPPGGSCTGLPAGARPRSPPPAAGIRLREDRALIFGAELPPDRLLCHLHLRDHHRCAELTHFSDAFPAPSTLNYGGQRLTYIGREGSLPSSSTGIRSTGYSPRPTPAGSAHTSPPLICSGSGSPCPPPSCGSGSDSRPTRPKRSSARATARQSAPRAPSGDSADPPQQRYSEMNPSFFNTTEYVFRSFSHSC